MSHFVEYLYFNMRYIKITYYKNNITIKVIKTNLKVIEAKEVWVIMFKDILKKEGQLKSNRDWKEKNKRYLENLQKFLDATDSIADECLRKHIIIQMLKCDLVLTKIAEKEIQKAKENLNELKYN